MTTSIKKESLAIWKVKLQLAAEGSYQAIQQVKDHILSATDDQHPIFKQSFYDILQQGYQLHQIQTGSVFPRFFETYKDIPLIFLISGSLEVKCINLEGDTETISKISQKGLATVERPALIKRFGQQNLNLLTKFQIVTTEDWSNKLEELMKRKEVTPKQNSIMRRFMLFPSKQVVRVSVNSMNQEHIKDRIYLISGRACYYLDDQKQFGRRLILSCYEQGYLNPKQFEAESESNSSIPSSFNIQQKKSQGNNNDQQNIKLYIFQNSEVMYLEQNFLKDDLIKAIQLKKQEHLNQVISRYSMIKNNKEAIEQAQNQLISKFKLSKNQLNCNVYKIVEVKKDKGFSSSKEQQIDKKLKTRSDLISTSSSIKCSIRIRKSKKIV